MIAERIISEGVVRKAVAHQCGDGSQKLNLLQMEQSASAAVSRSSKRIGMAGFPPSGEMPECGDAGPC